MGRRNRSYSKSLHQQAYDRLTGMLHEGEGTSKKEAIADGTAKNRIFSYSTYRTYWKHIKYFTVWVGQKHPDCTSLNKARQYVNEWLEERAGRVDKKGKHLSAWTIHTEAAALHKLYGIDKDDPKRYIPPARRRKDIIRSRNDVERDRRFSVSNNAELISFCRGTGCRRGVLEKLKKEDLWSREKMELELSRLNGIIPVTENSSLATVLKDALSVFPDQDYFIYHRKDKNGKSRFAPVIGPHKTDILRRFDETLPGKKVWQHVHDAADIHGYRSDYAMRIYKYYSRDIEDIPYDRYHRGTGHRYQSQVYVCRADESGKRLDKEAMLKVSKALGHNRLSVVADNYLRGL